MPTLKPHGVPTEEQIICEVYHANNLPQWPILASVVLGVIVDAAPFTETPISNPSHSLTSHLQNRQRANRCFRPLTILTLNTLQATFRSRAHEAQ